MAGHIQDRGNGSYLLVYHVGYDSNGKRIRKTKTVRCKNKTEARKELASFVTEIEVGEYVAPSNVKFQVYAERQFIKHLQKNFAPSTVELYTGILNNYIYDKLGHIQLDKFVHTHINEYIDYLEELELSTSTMQKHLNVLSGIFNLAVTNDIIAKSPMKKVKKISVIYEKGDVYTNEEVEQFIQLLDKEENKQMALLLKLAVTSGARRGELLALQWNDVDFTNNTIHIRHSISYTKAEGYVLRKPKTEKSIRTISINPKIMNELNKHKLIKNTDRLEANELWEGGKYFFVFSSAFGKPFFPTVPSRYFTRLLKRTGFKKIRFHDLRHTHVTYLINKGATLNDISKRLGHSSIAITYDVYGHLDRKKDETIANMFDSIL